MKLPKGELKHIKKSFKKDTMVEIELLDKRFKEHYTKIQKALWTKSKEHNKRIKLMKQKLKLC